MQGPILLSSHEHAGCVAAIFILSISRFRSEKGIKVKILKDKPMYLQLDVFIIA